MASTPERPSPLAVFILDLVSGVVYLASTAVFAPIGWLANFVSLIRGGHP